MAEESRWLALVDDAQTRGDVECRAERDRLRALIQRSGVSMLVNVDDRGVHVGRPMLPLLLEHDPHVYFLTHESSRKVGQLRARPQVALSIVGDGCYLMIVGRAQVSRDPALVRQLWHPSYRAWFPDGTNDREATVLRIVVERVDYWEPPGSVFVRWGQALKALITRQAAETPMKTIDGL